MQGILDELLTHSRPLVPLAPEEVDLARVVDDVLALHEAVAAQRDVRLERVGPAPVPLRCDPRKVRQVLLNLLQNALEASAPRSTIRIAVGVGEDAVRIDVDDEGSGLGAVELARAFDVGFTTKTTGSGLGLALARGLVRQHGGELTLSRREPRGCRASFTLSRSLAALDATVRPPPRASETLAEAT
jgi:signal transduction histidine kinase